MVDKQKNLQRLKEKLKSKVCDICGLPLGDAAIILYDVTNKHVDGVECMRCLSIYAPNLEIEHMGVTMNEGYA